MVQVTITMGNKDSMIRVLGKMPRKLRKSSIMEMKKLGSFIKRSIKSNVPVASGDLRKSIDVDYSNINRGFVYIVAKAKSKSGHDYAKAQEYGFEAHYVPMGFMHHSSTREFVGGASVEKLYGLQYRRGQARVSHHTPFMRPAYALAQKRMPGMVKHIGWSLKI